MQMIAIGSSTYDPAFDSDDDEDGEPFLHVEGVDGTSMRATATGIRICRCASPMAASTGGHSHWSYAQLGDLRIDAYGPIGVVRARIRDTGTDLPLLLLEPDQITAARRALEVIWNRMSVVSETRLAS